MTLNKYTLRTDTEGMTNITAQVAESVRESGVKNGICVVFCPHTTGGITINENADPDVVVDFLKGMHTAFPESAQYQHFEGNSTAHLRASCVGSSATVIVQNGSLLLGTWQGIYFCEFDGPRNRSYYVKVLEG